MPVLVWGILAVAAGFAVLTLSGRAAARQAPPLPPDVDLPPTRRLQQLARRGLAAGGLLAGGAAALLIGYGPLRLDQEDGPRLAFTAIAGTLPVGILVGYRRS
jgi:hypothetical protein